MVYIKANGITIKKNVIDKGFRVDYTYSSINNNEQIELQMFMLDENLETPYIGSVYLICKQ